MSFWRRLCLCLLPLLLLMQGCSKPEDAKISDGQASASYKIAWSHYPTWEIIPYMRSSGILKKWEDKYGVAIELVLINDYVESISSYTSGNFDGVFATNMDAFTIPGAGGIDSEVVLLTSSSNGNDAVVARGYKSIQELKGQKVSLVQFSVSHYLLARALAKHNMQEQDIVSVNASESDIDSVLLASSDPAALVTWNPILSSIKQVPNTQVLFDSASIPGEIVELMVMRTDIPEAPKKAMVGAWYETMQLLQGESRDELLSTMASSSGTTIDEFKAQVETTRVFFSQQEAKQFLHAPAFKQTTSLVYDFCVHHGLFGSADSAIGIALPSGEIVGNAQNTVIRYTDSYL